jgi:predicted DNA-binding protein
VADAERRALNEDIFREMNERLEELGEEFGEANVAFVCECADPSCSESLSIPVSVYEAVRSSGRRFVMLPGHQREDVERVIEEHADYLLVEKVGEAGEVAEDTDPRSDE